MTKQLYSTNTKWEEMAGYSRAVRVGDRIIVGGTVASGDDGVVGEGDPAAQFHFILDRIDTSIQALGGRFEDIIRIRIYISDVAHAPEIIKVHKERLDAIRPVNTLVEAKLVAPEYLVEVEVEAIVGAGG